MNILRLKFPFLVLIVFSLLISAASSPNPQASWIIETLDAPMYFDHLSSSMLKVIDGIPTMAFGGDHLYLRYWNYVSSSWVIETLDDSPGVGSYASLAKDAYGRTFISYFDSINQSLKFATPSDNIFIQGWEVETIDATVSSGKGNAIAVLDSGQPHISYTSHVGTTYYVKYSRRTCTGSFPFISCSWSTPEQVAAAIYDSVGTSIAIASDGTPHISYVDGTFILKHAYRVGGGSGNCGDGMNWQCETVPGQTGTIQDPTSLALYNNYPRIAFHDTAAGLSFAYQDAGGWHLSLLRPGLDLKDKDLSLTVDPTGLPHISYTVSDDHHVMHAFGSSPSGGSWTNENITGATFGGQTAIAYNTSPTAYPCILYYQTTNGYLEYTCKSSSWDTPSIVADSGNIGQDSSLAVTLDGVPHIAYMDYLSMPASPIHTTWSDIAAGCSDPATAAPWECEQLDDSTTGWGTGYKPSIAINPITGYPAVSYMAYTDTSSGLGFAWYVESGGNCPGNAAWSCTTIESIAGLVGFLPSLAFESNGRARIAYLTSLGELKLAAYLGSPDYNCNGDANWDCEVIDTGLGTASGKPSLVLDSTNIPVISYQNSVADQIKLATVVFSGGAGCSGGSYPGSWTCSVVDSTPGHDYIDSSLALASDSQVVISYSPGSLKYAVMSLPSGTTSIVVADGTNGGSSSSSLVLYQGTPWIAYSDANGQHSLRLAHQVGAGNGNCGDDSAWQCEVLDDGGSVGLYPSLKINSAGMAYISYYDQANGDLKLAYTRLFSFMPMLVKP